MRLAHVVLTSVVLGAGVLIAQACLSRSTPAEKAAAQAARHGPPAYVLPTDKLQQAIALGRTRRELTVANTILVPAEFLLLLASGAAAAFGKLAIRLSRSRWIQGFAFVFLLLLTLDLIALPLGMWAHEVGLSYGLSIQGWGSWFADRAKLFGAVLLSGWLLTMLLFWVIRKSPQRWWFWFGTAAIAVSLFGVYATPYIFDPLFNNFEPLTKSNPALVAQLERVVARGGLSIPPERMFLMKASAKSTEMNAYVTGFGASKRVVVWDTSVAKSTPDEIAFIFAHEMGHYALGHVVLGTTLTCAAMLPLFWIARQLVDWLLLKWGRRWGIGSQQEWAALVILLLVFSCISVVSDPLENGLSRAIEHAADVYGQEAVHGITQDPQAVGRQSFQVLGEGSLVDPTPHPVFDWWFGTHPPLWFRAGFAAAYDPWKRGEHPKYFAK